MTDMWAVAYHRIKAAEENAKDGKPGPCNCKDCKEYMAARGLDTRGRELKVSQEVAPE